MATKNGYNGSTDFESWYKQAYGTDYDKEKGLVRKDGMSDGDWDVGTVLHNYYLKNQENEADRAESTLSINTRYDGMIDSAKASYDSSRKTLAENKNVAQQNASVTYDKLKKYLPMKAQAQGLGGLGTESSALEAYNAYMSNLGKIGSDYNSDIAAIDTAQTEHVGELERYRVDSLSENDTLYDGIARSNQETADSNARSAWDNYLTAEKESQANNYSMVYDVLGTSTSTSADDLTAYVSQYRDKVTPEQYSALLQMAKNVAEYNINEAKINGFDSFEDEEPDDTADAPAEKDTQGNTPTADGLGLTIGGNNFTVEVNGESYSVQLAKDESGAAKYVTDSNVVAAAEGIPENGVFEFGGRVYVKKFGNVYEVEKRTLDNSEQYEALLSALRRKNEPHPNPQVSPDSLTNSSAKESITNNFENIFNAYNQPADMIPQSGGGGYRNRLDQYLHTRE